MTAPSQPTPGHSRRSPIGGYVHGGVVTLLLIAVITLALVVTPPSPPSIAEFAPKATETIDEALKQQASQFGTGEGGDCAGGQECADGGGPGTTTTTTMPIPGIGPGKPPKRVVEIAKVKHCVGDPPRQVEDPQSPPCANYWEGDNGGATSKGVTATEIRVAYPVESVSREMFERFIPFFNKRFQFYGRQIKGVPVSANQESFAVSADEQKVFAALDYHQQYDYTFSAEPIFRELAKRKIVGVAGRTRRFTDAEIRQLSPYYWQYAPSVEFLLRQTGALACRLKESGLARHGGAEQKLKSRKFAVIYERHVDGTTFPVKALDEALAQCGEKAQHYEMVNQHITERRARAEDMRLKNITTLITALNVGEVTNEMQGYANANFEPELLMSGYSMTQSELQLQTYGDAARRSHMFGVAGFNKLNPQADEPAVWAAKEAKPEDPNTTGHAGGATFYDWYHSLLLLASGIQQAGPNLTPETFAEGLEKAKFPNPGAGRAPFWQARVGFGPSDHTMVDDVTGIWWNEAAPSYRSPTNPRAGWCYVAQGSRKSALPWPQNIDDMFFAGNCR